MTQHPGPNDPTEDEDPRRSEPAEEASRTGGSPRQHPTKPLGGTPEGAAAPGSDPGQRPGGGYGAPGYGYGQQQGGYSGQGQPGPAGQQPGGQYSGHSYQQPYPPQQPTQNPGASPQSRSPESRSFFAALFDFSFQSFVAVKFAKFIYAILIAFLVVGYLFVVIVAFTQGAAEGMVALLLGWIPAAIYLILIRISLEFMIALVRTSQNTAGTRSEIEALRSELRSRR